MKVLGATALGDDVTDSTDCGGNVRGKPLAGGRRRRRIGRTRGSSVDVCVAVNFGDGDGECRVFEVEI